MQEKTIFELVVGRPETKQPGWAAQKRERRILRKLLDIGSCYVALQAQGSAEPTPLQLYVFLGQKYELHVIEDYLLREQQRLYLAAMQREPSIFLRGLEYLEATEPPRREESQGVAQEVEDLQRVYRGDPRGRGGM